LITDFVIIKGSTFGFDLVEIETVVYIFQIVLKPMNSLYTICWFWLFYVKDKLF